MDARDRLAAYLVTQFVAVAVLSTAVAAMLGRFPFGDTHTTAAVTTPAAWVATTALDAATVVLFVVPLCASIGILVAGRSTADRSRVLVGAVIAVLAVPTLGAFGVAGFLVGSRVGQLLSVVLLVGGVPVLAGVVAQTLGLFAVADRTRADDAVDRARAPGDRTTLLLVGVVCLGALVGLAGVTGGADALVERDRIGTPQTAFAFTYDPVNETHGVLTVDHAGGDAVPRERLAVGGDGIAAVDGVDQSVGGTWAGEASVNRSGTRFVRPGDAVTVGVGSDCDVRVVYERRGRQSVATTLDRYECGDGERE